MSDGTREESRFWTYDYSAAELAILPDIREALDAPSRGDPARAAANRRRYPKVGSRGGIPRRHRRTWYLHERYANKPGYAMALASYRLSLLVPVTRQTFPTGLRGLGLERPSPTGRVGRVHYLANPRLAATFPRSNHEMPDEPARKECT